MAPLDWGLGHVSRCVPLMRHIRAAGHEVIFAGNDSQKSYIRDIFPDITCLTLPGYNITYSRSRAGFMPKLWIQLPGVRHRIRAEHQWLNHVISEYHPDAVISDNRYGLYTHRIPCVFITHQLQVQTGLGAFADRLLQLFHYRFIQRFSNCWVADVAKDPGISGILAHPRRLPAMPLTYTGLLSQCVPEEPGNSRNNYVLILLSGAEPQRSLLSDLLWQQVQGLNRKVVFVEGTATAQRTDIPAHVRYYPRVAAEMLRQLINDAAIVICRSGYSSLMDLAATDQKAVLIPTPGQTEQEYLARQLFGRQQQLSFPQKDFVLSRALEAAGSFPFLPMAAPGDFTLYRQVADKWLAGL